MLSVGENNVILYLDVSVFISYDRCDFVNFKTVSNRTKYRTDPVNVYGSQRFLCGNLFVNFVFLKLVFIVYYESINRKPKIKPISESRCDERLKLCVYFEVVYYESRKRELKIMLICLL